MSYIDQLINQRCKEGIKCFKIKDLFTRLKGTPITAGKMKEIEKNIYEIEVKDLKEILILLNSIWTV